MPAKFGRLPFPRSSVILFSQLQKEWQNDHITSALLADVTRCAKTAQTPTRLLHWRPLASKSISYNISYKALSCTWASGFRSTPKFYHFWRVIPRSRLPCLVDIRSRVILRTGRQTDRQTSSIT